MPLHNSMLGTAPTAPMSGYPQTQMTTAVGTAVTPGSIVIDGTPLRVVTFIVASVAGVVALRWAGLKFNVSAGV